MSRYIDVEPLEKALKMNANGFKHEGSNYAKGFDAAIATMKGILQGLPTADVVEVVRCKECRHGQQVGDLGVVCEYGCEEYRPFDHFCGWGERRDFASDTEDE